VTVLDAARRLFVERGFVRTSIPDIAAEAGVAAGTVYRYFADKNDLVLAACDLTISSVLEGAGQQRSVSSDTVEALVLAMFERVVGEERRHGYARLAVQVWAEAATNQPLAAALHERLQQARDEFAGLIAGAAKDRQEQEHPRRFADLIFVALNGFTNQVAIGLEPDPRALVAQLVAVAPGFSR
jgi:AcrR family transcriptional regulator